MAKCTAIAKRTGKQCQMPAIKGKNKCRVHGGMTPIKHGLFSKYPEAVAGEHIRAAKETELKEMLKDSAALLGAVLSSWTEKGLPFDINYFKATCALAGRLTAAIKVHEEIKKMQSHEEDNSQFGLFLGFMTGAIRTPEEIAAYLNNQGRDPSGWSEAVYGTAEPTRKDRDNTMEEIWADENESKR